VVRARAWPVRIASELCQNEPRAVLREHVSPPAPHRFKWRGLGGVQALTPRPRRRALDVAKRNDRFARGNALTGQASLSTSVSSIAETSSEPRGAGKRYGSSPMRGKSRASDDYRIAGLIAGQVELHRRLAEREKFAARTARGRPRN